MAKNEKKTKKKTRKELEVLDRQNEVLDLYMSGLSYRRISKALQAKDVQYSSVGTVFSDVQAALEDARKNLRLKAENMLELELQRLDKLLLSVYTRALRYGERDDITSVLEIMRQRDKYLQLSKSEKSKNSAREALAKLLGKSPEELPSGKPDA